MIKKRLLENADLVEQSLAGVLSGEDVDFGEIRAAQRYSLLSRAKRIRPTLVLEFCRLFGGADDAAIPFAMGVEMVHTYSLIHDDLPCMDDDDLRRGKPSCHKAFGEAGAVLAGDALLTRAFGVVAENPHVAPEQALAAVSALSHAAGDFGMIAGQVMDLAGEGQGLSLDKLEKLHSLKTGEMIGVSAVLGCLAAGLSLADERTKAARRFAMGVGLAFQIVDDVLDATSDTATLGKTVHSDTQAQKTTFLTYYTPDEALALAADLTQKAKKELVDIPGAEQLLALADYLIDRTY